MLLTNLLSFLPGCQRDNRGEEHDDMVTEEEGKCTPLRGKASRISVNDLLETLMKFLNFEGGSKDQKAYFVERSSPRCPWKTFRN